MSLTHPQDTVTEPYTPTRHCYRALHTHKTLLLGIQSMESSAVEIEIIVIIIVIIISFTSHSEWHECDTAFWVKCVLRQSLSDTNLHSNLHSTNFHHMCDALRKIPNVVWNTIGRQRRIIAAYLFIYLFWVHSQLPVSLFGIPKFWSRRDLLSDELFFPLFAVLLGHVSLL